MDVMRECVHLVYQCFYMFVSLWVLFVCADINECVSTPCQNQASCVDMVDQYECVCAQGYVGEYCESGEYYRIHNTSTVQVMC